MLEDDWQKEFKDEIRKIKLGMMQLIDQLQYEEKDTEVIERENIERIEIETEVEKLKQPQTEISKQMKQEKDREKLKEKGKVIEQERFERKKSRKKLRKKKMKEESEKHKDWLEERQIVDESQEQEQSVERRKFGGNLTEQEVSMERFESVFDHFDVKYAEIEECEDYENEMD